MRPRMLYVIDATLGFGWTFYIAGSYSPSFPWRYVPLPLGWIFLAGCTALTWNSKKHWTKWLPVVGTGLIAAYFVPATVATIPRYARGEVIASTTQVGIALTVAAFVAVCFGVALWDLLRVRHRESPNRESPNQNSALAFAPTMNASRFKTIVWKSFLVLFCGLLLTILLLGRLVLVEIPGDYKRWIVIRDSDARCPPLTTRGLFRVVSVPTSGKVCTSSREPFNLTYVRFEYVYPDGRRKYLPWSGSGGDTWAKVWLLGYDINLHEQDVFVGDVHEMNNSGPPMQYDTPSHKK